MANLPNTVSDLQPGDVIEFARLDELPVFEDALVEYIHPAMADSQAEMWTGRVAIQELLRPPKFHGAIADVQLLMMDQPYARLLDARQRGWKIPGGYSLGYTSTEAIRLIPAFKGFILKADARSTGRGSVGGIHAELWYGPMSLNRRNAYGPINRFVTAPKVEASFDRFQEASRRIGFNTLRDAMRRPTRIPMKG